MEFENFIRDTVSNIKPSSIALYADVVLVESYFEFITRVLLGQFELSDIEERKWKQSVCIDRLASKKSQTFDQNDKAIFHAVRALRNKMVHNILFKPDIKALKEFIKTCFNKELGLSKEHRCSTSFEELERTFCHQIVTAYAKMTNKFKRQVDKKIADYLKTKTDS